MLRKTFILLMLTIGVTLSAKSSQIVVLETTLGNIHIKLFPEVAPKACENFSKLIEKGYYNNTVFHRVIKGFMIQGGDPTGSGVGGESIWGKLFQDEVSKEIRFDKPGLLAMANRGPNTNGSQFFITTSKTPWLNMCHTIFGEIIQGYEIVEKISEAKTDSRDKPLESLKVIKAYQLGD